MRSAPALHTLIVVSLALLAAACKSGGLPEPGSQEYRETVTAFYVGLAGLQTGEDVRAREKLTRTTELAPGEPAGWANLGLLSLRQQELDAAYELLAKARTLAPDNSRIESLLGLLETKRGKQAEAVAHLRRAVELDQKNLRAVYALAQELERQGGDENEAEALRLAEQIVAAQPDNTAALLELTRLAAKRGEGEKVKRAVERIAPKAPAWPAEVQQPFAALQAAALGANPRQAATQVAFLRNALARVPDYRQSLEQIRTPAEFVGEPFTKFIKLPSPSSSPAPADMAMKFEAQPIPGVSEGWTWIGQVSLDSESKPSLVVANSYAVKITNGAQLNYPGRDKNGQLFGAMPDGVLAVDLNYDFKTDFVLVGFGGIKIYRQESANSFVEATAQAMLPADVLSAEYFGAWPIDADLDGDLDILLSPRDAPALILRNNGDGSFKDLPAFDGKTRVRYFVSADIDGDGDPDAALLDQGGRLHVFNNERLGQYRLRPLPDSFDVYDLDALATGDINGDGLIDLVAHRGNGGAIYRFSDKGGGAELEVDEFIKGAPTDATRDPYPMGSMRLLVADLDNNGSLDLVFSRINRHSLWLSDGRGGFSELVKEAEGGLLSVADVTDDGKPDLLGVQYGRSAETPRIFVNRGTKNYHHQIIRTRAAKATGDQRINSFGIGGEIEIRAGLLTQKQVITSPLLHFGLGEQTETDVARIVWPNGSVQAEFELKADQAVLAEQRLKGSCPMLFAWDGKQMSFVKDAPPWSPALGLHINAQLVPQVQQTEEWFKIPGQKLVPRDGFYDLRITAELWEVYYIDHYSLVVVDHPAGTEVFTDERFAVPEPPLAIYATAKPAPVVEAKDDRGQDVTDIVRELDGRYLDTFGRGAYQGVARDHWVEVLLPESAPRDGQLWLAAHGWLHPTDGSINIALTQNQPSPRGLSLEVQDEKGNWAVAKPNLGFPAGKNKTVMIDLTGVFKGRGARRLRLRTNMEIYWDKLECAAGLPESIYKAQRVGLSGAELRYRGFSEVSAANESSPEVFDYNRLRGTAPRWRDMIGYYTRHGDVYELLKAFDDRYVIVGAGDELRLKFPEAAPPPAGWVRDYVIIGNGWIKDGDLNSTFSKTVLPLPSRATKDYNVPPRALEDDPVYQRHKEDWQTYHTRYVAPERFLMALRAGEE
jgi:Flp pilus assembly protein TadD